MLNVVVLLLIAAAVADAAGGAPAAADKLQFTQLSNNPKLYGRYQPSVYITSQSLTFNNVTWPAGSTMLYGGEIYNHYMTVHEVSISKDLVSWTTLTSRNKKNMYSTDGASSYCLTHGGVAYIIPFGFDFVHDFDYFVWSSRNLTTWTKTKVNGDIHINFFDKYEGFSSVVDHNGNIYVFFGLSLTKANNLFPGVLQSTDQGSTWNLIVDRINPNLPRYYSQVTLVYGKTNDTIYALGGITQTDVYYDLWATQDYGRSWTRRFSKTPWTPVINDYVTLTSTKSGLLLVHLSDIFLTNSQIWTSTDTGYNWVLQAAAPAFGARIGPGLYINPKGHLVVISGAFDSNTPSFNDVWISVAPIEA